MKPALLIMFCLSWVFCPAGAYPDWPYLYGDLAGRSVLPVEPLKSHTLDFLVQDSRPIPTDLSDLRAADVDGDSYPEIMGVSLDGQELWVIDYFAQDMRVPNITGGIIHLAGLLDYDGDGSSDILFTQQAAGEPAWHRIFSVQQQKFLMQIEDRSGYEIIQAVTVLDFDFDGSDDLLVSRYAADRESLLVLMDVNSGEERAQIHIPGRPSVAQMALIQHEEFLETLLFFVTAPYPGANKKMVFYLQGYYMGSGVGQFELLWNKTFTTGMQPSRIGLAQGSEGEEMLIVGTQCLPGYPSRTRSLLALDALDGSILHEINLGEVDCLDVVICNLDQDSGDEVIVLGGDQNFHKINFAAKQDRILTVKTSSLLVGATKPRTEQTEMVVVLESEGKESLYFISGDFEPNDQPPHDLPQGQRVGRPILCDVDRNGKGDVVFCSNDGISRIHWAHFYDLVAITPTPPIPVSTPTPSPTPTKKSTPETPSKPPSPTPFPSVLDWRLYP